MELPVDLQGRIDKLAAEQDTYAYRGNLLANKTFIGLIAPTAVGKSTLIDESLRQCKELGVNAGEADTITTRPRRLGDDPPNYVTADEGVTFDSMIERIEKGELTNWSQHGTGHLYGTAPEGFAYDYNFLPTMPGSMPMLERAGFAKFIGIYLVITVDQWTMQLDARLDDPRFAGRMVEAVKSLEYAKSNQDKLIILNNSRGEGELAARARAIIAHMTKGAPLVVRDNPAKLLDDMLAFAKRVIDGNA